MMMVAAPRETGARAASKSRKTRSEILHFIGGLLLLLRLRFRFSLLFGFMALRCVDFCVGSLLAVNTVGRQTAIGRFCHDHETHGVFSENGACCTAGSFEGLYFSGLGSGESCAPLQSYRSGRRRGSGDV